MTFVRARKTFMHYKVCAGNIQPFCPKRTHSKCQRAKERAATKLFWKYSPNTQTTQAVYAKALLTGAQNRRKQLTFEALTFEEQNIQRQPRQGSAQLATATHDHEKPRERQACDLSCPYFVSFSSQSKKAQDKSRQPFCLYT